MSDAKKNDLLLVACSLPVDQSKDTVLSILKSRLYDGSNLCEVGFPPVKFDVPDGEQSLKFGSFDNLIKLMDDLVKHDASVEQVLRRMERQTIELIPDVQFKVLAQRQPLSWDTYVKKFQWDDSKYPKARPLQDNLQVILSAISKLDEEVRNKSSALQELKSSLNTISKREGNPLTTLDLIDVLTPTVVREGNREHDDFIYTEHLTTVVVVVPKGDKDFLKKYEKCADKVVPQSARQFKGISDKDGNTLWRVVMFKKAVEDFRRGCKDFCTFREFEYKRENYNKIVDMREQKKVDFEQQEKFLKKICQATFSDTLVAWMHIKAMRVFVESVLRFGVPPRFASFMIKPDPRSVAKVRAVLNDMFSKSSQFGKSYTAGKSVDDGEGEDYFPYVSLSFSPLVVPRAS